MAQYIIRFYNIWGKCVYEDKIQAYSLFEAKINFIKEKFCIIPVIHQYNASNRDNILKYYYKVNHIYIPYLTFAPISDLLYSWNAVAASLKSISIDFKIPKQMLDEISHNINWTIPSLIWTIRKCYETKNDKFIAYLITRNCFNIKAYKNTFIPPLTFVTIKMIFKKIRNTNYWHIWRLFLC